MARFVKDGAFGYKAVPGGQSDPECTHVIMTLKEYDKLLQEKARAEQEARSTKYSAEREIEEAKRAAMSNKFTSVPHEPAFGSGAPCTVRATAAA